MSYRLEQVTSKHSRIYRQVENYYIYCEQIRGMSPTTMISKVYTINQFIAVTRITDLRKLSNRQIYDWINYQFSRGNTGRTINDRLAHLRAMLHWQQNMNVVMPHLQLGLITKAKEVPPRQVCFSRQEIQSVLATADIQEWLLIKLAFDCGLRISELCKLQLNHLHDDGRISILGKGSKRRYAYLSPEVQYKLQVWIADHCINKYLWPSPIYPDQPLATCTIRQKMRDAFSRAGFKDFRPHDLRHSYATDLKKIGIPTRKIQAGLGHASEATTERYLSDLIGWDLYELYQQKYNYSSASEC